LPLESFGTFVGHDSGLLEPVSDLRREAEARHLREGCQPFGDMMKPCDVIRALSN
jgi:hypothetical protein